MMPVGGAGSSGNTGPLGNPDCVFPFDSVLGTVSLKSPDAAPALPVMVKVVCAVWHRGHYPLVDQRGWRDRGSGFCALVNFNQSACVGPHVVVAVTWDSAAVMNGGLWDPVLLASEAPELFTLFPTRQSHPFCGARGLCACVRTRSAFREPTRGENAP